MVCKLARGRFYMARNGSVWQVVDDIIKIPAPSNTVAKFCYLCKCIKADPGLREYDGTHVGQAGWFSRNGRWSGNGECEVDLVEQVRGTGDTIHKPGSQP
jgi:hypothetical protein